MIQDNTTNGAVLQLLFSHEKESYTLAKFLLENSIEEHEKNRIFLTAYYAIKIHNETGKKWWGITNVLRNIKPFHLAILTTEDPTKEYMAGETLRNRLVYTNLIFPNLVDNISVSFNGLTNKNIYESPKYFIEQIDDTINDLPITEYHIKSGIDIDQFNKKVLHLVRSYKEKKFD